MKKDKEIIFINAKDEIYYNIGKFIVEFENMLQALYKTLTEFLEEQSTYMETEYIESLLCELDAMSLVTKFYNLYGIKYTKNVKNLQLIKKIYSRTQLIVEFRNVLVHNPWDFSSEQPYVTEFKKIFGKLRKFDEQITSVKAKKGATKHITYWKSVDLNMIKEYMKQIINIKQILSKLSKYHGNERDIIINLKSLKVLDKKINQVQPEDFYNSLF